METKEVSDFAPYREAYSHIYLMGFFFSSSLSLRFYRVAGVVPCVWPVPGITRGAPKPGLHGQVPEPESGRQDAVQGIRQGDRVHRQEHRTRTYVVCVCVCRLYIWAKEIAQRTWAGNIFWKLIYLQFASWFRARTTCRTWSSRKAFPMLRWDYHHQ